MMFDGDWSFLLSHLGPWNKSLNGLFLAINMYISPQSLKFSHWLARHWYNPEKNTKKTHPNLVVQDDVWWWFYHWYIPKKTHKKKHKKHIQVLQETTSWIQLALKVPEFFTLSNTPLLGGWAPRTGHGYVVIGSPPFRKAIYKGNNLITPFRGQHRITMVINHVSKSWDDPPSTRWFKPCPFYPLFGGHVYNLWRGHVFTIPKRARFRRIARYLWCFFEQTKTWGTKSHQIRLLPVKRLLYNMIPLKFSHKQEDYLHHKKKRKPWCFTAVGPCRKWFFNQRKSWRGVFKTGFPKT